MAYSMQNANWLELVLNWPSRQVGHVKAPVGVKLFGAFFTTTLLIVLLGYISLQALTASQTRLKEASRLQEQILIFSRIENQARRLQLAAANVLLGNFAGVKTIDIPLTRGVANGQFDAAELQRRIQRDNILAPSDTKILNEALRDFGQALELAKRIHLAIVSGKTEDSLRIYTGAFESEVEKVQIDYYNSTRAWESELAALLGKSQEAFDASRMLVVLFCLAAIVIAALLGSIFSAAIIEPVRQLKRSFSALSSGDFSKEVSVYNRDEFGDLATHLNATMKRLGTANTDLQEANRHKSDFLANMSHELRTPLNAIIGFTRIVSRKCADILPAKQMDNLGKVKTSAEHLLSLINGILDLSKIEAGKMEVHSKQFNPAGVIKACARMAEPLKGDKPIIIHAEIPDDLPTVTSDQDMLRQITLNLLSNAIKFTQSGSVTLSTKARDGQLMVTVTDTGIGISPENLPRIFDEFTQAEGHTARKFGGTGLGLAISSKMTSLLGGNLTATSKEGLGSTFTLTIPFALPNASESEA